MLPPQGIIIADHTASLGTVLVNFDAGIKGDVVLNSNWSISNACKQSTFTFYVLDGPALLFAR